MKFIKKYVMRLLVVITVSLLATACAQDQVAPLNTPKLDHGQIEQSSKSGQDTSHDQHQAAKQQKTQPTEQEKKPSEAQKQATDQATNIKSAQRIESKTKSAHPEPSKKKRSKDSSEQQGAQKNASAVEKKATSAVKKSTKKTSVPSPPQENKEATARLTITGYQGKAILSSQPVTIQDKDTCLSMAERVLKAKGIPISVRGSGATAYVEGIANQFEFDHGPNSGWLVEKNGEELTHSVGATTVQPGDQIVWKYTTDYKRNGG
ncbi:hypothetical protein GCM10011391_19430 [Pullulanibacillus camelliae]|uniref:Transcobalamin-like C-terminal domain-containing protein n=1 Tax=Pullulanibacillus camelliae TaxID=1707096 RepID=A0A8J2YH50_9BACL|nr:DUF4430 domain-containing protein [Pullulanibacillus camelliae]GGE40762.1 hypothetical protein GCM10011391_19430 [Pullulanibacillus camelliae]